MSDYRDVEFHLGETWIMAFTVVDGDDEVIDITGATLQFRLANGVGTVMTRTVGDGFTITAGTDGECVLSVSPLHQTNAAVTAQRYTYEFRATTVTSVVTVQVRGQLNVLPSLFV